MVVDFQGFTLNIFPPDLETRGISVDPSDEKSGRGLRPDDLAPDTAQANISTRSRRVHTVVEMEMPWPVRNFT